MSLWLAASAVAPELGERWGLSPSELGGFTSAVQLGFVLGTLLLAVLNVGDLMPSARLFAISATIGALTNALLLAAPTYDWALVTRMLTGVALAATLRRHHPALRGVYIADRPVQESAPILVRPFTRDELLDQLSTLAVAATSPAS
jgi:MFS family permease